MKWEISVEGAPSKKHMDTMADKKMKGQSFEPGTWTPTGETFSGTADEVQARLEALQVQTGKCYGAKALG